MSLYIMQVIISAGCPPLYVNLYTSCDVFVGMQQIIIVIVQLYYQQRETHRTRKYLHLKAILNHQLT